MAIKKGTGLAATMAAPAQFDQSLGGSSIPINYGHLQMSQVPYLEQKYTPNKYSPKLTSIMDAGYTAGILGLTDQAYSRMPWTLPNLEALTRKAGVNAPKIGQVNTPDIPNPTFDAFNFDPIEQQARAGFEQQTIPTIAERFTNMGQGASSSGAFARTLGGAAAGLEQDLAAQKAQILPQWQMQQAQYGLQRSGLEQQNAQMQLQRDIAQGQLQLGASGLESSNLNALSNYALGTQSAALQQQQQRTSALLGLLGFSPPSIYGAPTVRNVPNTPSIPGMQNSSNKMGSGAATPAQAAGDLGKLGYTIPAPYLAQGNQEALAMLSW